MNTIQATTNYRSLTTLNANREVADSHVNSLKAAFATKGNLTEIQPIIVNEHNQIIDGQHRAVAAEQLGLPINYITVPGLTVHDAVSMNILHKSWTADDYAHSYATAGNDNYVRYLKLRDDYPFKHSIVLNYTCGGELKGIYRQFREGNFVLTPELDTRTRLLLDCLEAAAEVIPQGLQKEFALAYIKAMFISGFKQERMIRKLKNNPDLMRRYAGINDYLRALEDVYNYQMPEASRVRFF